MCELHLIFWLEYDHNWLSMNFEELKSVVHNG